MTSYNPDVPALSLYNPNSPELAKAFPQLRIISMLGEGGQKYVYKATTNTKEIVALKIIKVEQNPDRSIREIAAAAQFGPPRFPKVYDHGSRKVGPDNVIFIIEEFIEGISLRKRLECVGALGETEALRIGQELLRALIEVAEQDLVHRDVKPENIMLGSNDQVVLLDFGIAKHLTLNSLTHDKALHGPLTPGYGAPEQIKNLKHAISPRTDLFAWAVVMYEMIAGFNPFLEGCSNPQEVMNRTLEYEPPRLTNCGSTLSNLIAMCMAKEPHMRPPHPKYVLNALEGGAI